MARTLQQIVTELNKADSSRIKNIKKQEQSIGKQLQADESALGAQKNQAFDDILAGARRRGLGFAGIPLGEQAEFTATQYLPELARLRQGAATNRRSLQDMIFDISSGNRKEAMGIRQAELDRAEAIRQFNENLALERERLARSGSGGGGGGGFNFAFPEPEAVPQQKQPNVSAVEKQIRKQFGNYFTKLARSSSASAVRSMLEKRIRNGTASLEDEIKLDILEQEMAKPRGITIPRLGNF